MSFATAVPYWKLLPFILYVVTYYHITDYKNKPYPEETLMTVIFKALPMMSLVFIVLSAETYSRQHTSFKRIIFIGQLFSMLGDAFLVRRIAFFIPGLLSFAVAHLFYILAYGFKPFGGGPTLASCSIIGGFIYKYLYDSITDPLMKFLVLLYLVLIFTMTWRALVRLMQSVNVGTVCAFIGAVLFVASDMMIAIDKWKFEIKDPSFWIMLTYFGAQMFIALSAASYERKDAHIWKKKTK